MDKCPFHKIYNKNTSSNEINYHQSAVNISVPYCTHKHSPLSELLVKNAIGVSGIVTCNADLDKCHIAKELLEDFR